MNTPAKLGVFAVGLVAAFGAAVGVGTVVGPVGAVQPPASEPPAAVTVDAPAAAAAGELPGGLVVSQDGYTLALAQDALPAGAGAPVAFRVLGPDGQPVTAYEPTHDEDLHFIAVRRDMSGFQHVHPELGADGTWRTPLSLTPGDWRVFADFAPAGQADAMTLGADLAVGGEYAPRPLPEAVTTAQVYGYTVTLDGALVPGAASPLTLSVSRDGIPVTDLEPYLAAYGHLVVLRDGDLAYLHVHPTGEPGDGRTPAGPQVQFVAEVPSAGSYRLFLDFQHAGVVRTAEFTAVAGGAAPVAASSQGSSSDGHGH
jgi:hypothetical protein